MDLSITDWVVIYAAILSTFIFLWNILSSRSKLEVDLIHGLNDTSGDLEFGVQLSIRNPSSHTVYVNSVSLLYEHKKVTIFEKIKFIWRYRRLRPYTGWVHNSLIFRELETGLPRTIEPRSSHMIFIPENAIWDMLDGSISRVFAAVAQDALWRNRYSAKFIMHEKPQ